jgi:hypothetical protein
MTTADEFREYAKECLRWADEAETDEQRQSFLDMARDWTLAAMRLDGMLGQDDPGQPFENIRQKTHTSSNKSA